MTSQTATADKPKAAARRRRRAPKGASAPLTALHSSLPGRLRLQVPGLRGSHVLKARLEQAIAHWPDVASARANIASGTLLIRFADDLPHDDMAARVTALLETRGPAAKTPPKKKSTRKKAETPLPPESGPAWHRMETDEAFGTLDASHEGLDAAAAEDRLTRFGPNDVAPTEARSDLSILIEQFKSLPVAMLTGSSVLSAATGGVADAAVTMAVIGANGAIGYATESQAERTIRDITGPGKRYATVLRDGLEVEIPAADVVPGDVLILAPGQYVTADARLFRTMSLTVDESALTGESVPTSKSPKPVEGDPPLAERTNMVFRGTVVAGGSGTALVVATGDDTEIGRIQKLTGDARPPQTPIERELDKMSRDLVLLSLGVSAGVFGLGLLRGYPALNMLKSSVALAVAAVPEGLPGIATSTLALGIRELKRKNVLVRQLGAVEGLGSLEILCFDKTGTLTENRMTVMSLFAGGSYYRIHNGNIAHAENERAITLSHHHELKKLLEVAALCSEVRFERDDEAEDGSVRFIGSPTETALAQLPTHGGIDVMALQKDNPRERIVYRSEKRKYMATRHTRQSDGKPMLGVKGSPDQVLELCTYQEIGGVISELGEEERTAILVENERMSGEGLRVLGLAYTHDADAGADEPHNMIWVGLVAMADPVRDGVKELIGDFHKAGIRTVMITGDQPATAKAIASQLNLGGNGEIEVLDANHLSRFTPEELADAAERAHVFARVSPAAKLEIVRALQSRGHVVGMTGDGINDGPALRAADVGIAMGKGADAARDVADIVIRDDDLTTLAGGIAQGRTTYANIRKAIHFLLATNLSEIMVIVAELMNPGDTPESPMEMLWINLVTDVLPGLGLALEPPERGVMSQPPRDPHAPMFTGTYYKQLAGEAGILSAASLAAHFYGLSRYGPGPQTRSVTLMTLILGQLLHAITCRSDRFHSLGGNTLFGNKKLLAALGGAAGLQALPLFVPPLRRLLGIGPLGPADFAVILGAALASFSANEALLEYRTAREGLLEDEIPDTDNLADPAA